MNYFFDTEFIDDGKTIELISIGIVDQYGAAYYAESAECDKTRFTPWLEENVAPHLHGKTIPRKQIADEIAEFCHEPRFWAWFGAYDWVALAQLYGPLMVKPKGWPHRFSELADLPGLTRQTKLPEKPKNCHNALADACWNREVWLYMGGV